MKTFRENTSLDSVIIVNSNIEGPNMSEKIYSAGADYYIRKSDYVPTQLIYMIEQGMFANKRSTAATPAVHTYHQFLHTINQKYTLFLECIFIRGFF